LLTLFLSLITNPNFYTLILVPSLTALFVLILWIISIATGKEMNLNLGPLKLNLVGGKKTSEPVEPITGKNTHPPDRCSPKDIETCNQNQAKKANQSLLISRLHSFITEKQKTIYRTHTENMERQMNFFDEKLVEIRSMYIEEYARLLEKKTEKTTDVRNHQEFRNYRMMVDLMLDDIKTKTYKKSIKQNHLADITMELWESFVEQKVNVTLAMIKEFFDNNYPDDMTIARREIDEANERVFDKCRSLFTLSYRRAREIAIETRTKVKYIEDEIEREVRDENIHLTRIDAGELESM